ncbi:MAG: hypothetical protein ABIL01_32840 [Pseudomonadota bacterium]
MKVNVLVLFASLLVSPDAIASCLDDAEIFAGRVCGEISNRGSSRLVTGSGELNAEAKGLLRSLLGSAGGELKGETQFSVYENVLREQLGPELVNVRDCRTRMVEAAIKQACDKPARIQQQSSGSSSPNIVTNGNVDVRSK